MTYDVAIIGAGIAGASLAAELAPHLSVILIEAEDQPGYHATGRSAAFWSETYGGPLVQPLSSASGPFLAAPKASFSDRSFLRQRGALTIGRERDETEISAFLSEYATSGVELQRFDAEHLRACVPDALVEWDRAVWEPSTADIDVAGLHAAYLRVAKQNGAALAVRSPVSGIRRVGQGWDISTGAQTVSATRIVNAAGAWADEIATCAGARPLGITPYRRTMVQLEVSADVPADLPLIVDINERFYFKPEGPRRIWLSPHDETPSAACDAAPEEIDVATAIDRFERVMAWPVVRVERTWAGLRSFAPDRLPVFGADPDVCGFYWCAGQGGFGIQTAPSISKLLASLILGQQPDDSLSALDVRAYAPDRVSLES